MIFWLLQADAMIKKRVGRTLQNSKKLILGTTRFFSTMQQQRKQWRFVQTNVILNWICCIISNSADSSFSTEKTSVLVAKQSSMSQVPDKVLMKFIIEISVNIHLYRLLYFTTNKT